MFRMSLSGIDAATHQPVTYDKVHPVQPENLLAVVLEEFHGGARTIEIELTPEAERAWNRPS